MIIIITIYIYIYSYSYSYSYSYGYPLCALWVASRQRSHVVEKRTVPSLRKLRIWTSEGLTQASSTFCWVGIPRSVGNSAEI